VILFVEPVCASTNIQCVNKCNIRIYNAYSSVVRKTTILFAPVPHTVYM